ncbi:MAG: phospholipase D family protein [Phycisphaeraceae bacterium]
MSDLHLTPDFARAMASPGDGGPAGSVQLVVDAEHQRRVVQAGMLKAKVSLAVATADFKAMLVPAAGPGGAASGGRRGAPSIVAHLVRLAKQGVEVRVLHAGVPSSAALRELRGTLPANLTIRRCPRLHAKAVIVDAKAMYLGSANLTGAGLGAKADARRNIEWGVWTESSELIDAVLQQFNALWEGERCTGCGRREICPVPLEEPKL